MVIVFVISVWIRRLRPIFFPFPSRTLPRSTRTMTGGQRPTSIVDLTARVPCRFFYIRRARQLWTLYRQPLACDLFWKRRKHQQTDKQNSKVSSHSIVDSTETFEFFWRQSASPCWHAPATVRALCGRWVRDLALAPRLFVATESTGTVLTPSQMSEIDRFPNLILERLGESGATHDSQSASRSGVEAWVARNLNGWDDSDAGLSQAWVRCPSGLASLHHSRLSTWLSYQLYSFSGDRRFCYDNHGSFVYDSPNLFCGPTGSVRTGLTAVRSEPGHRTHLTSLLSGCSVVRDGAKIWLLRVVMGLGVYFWTWILRGFLFAIRFRSCCLLSF